MTGKALPLVAMLLAAQVATVTVARADGWQGIADAYGQWTVNTLHTSLLGDALEGPRGPVAPKPPWPAITGGDVAAHVFSIRDLGDMRDNNQSRAAQILTGQRITVEGLARRGTDKMLWLDAPRGGTAYKVQASWPVRAGVPDFPADGTLVRVEGLVRKVTPAWVELREPVFRQPDAKPGPQTPAGTAPAGDGFGFVSSASVSAGINARFAAELAAMDPDGPGEEAVLAFLNSNQLQQEFSRVLRRYGWSDHNLADVMAAHLILLWQVAHDAPDREVPEGFNAIRDSLRQELRQAGWVARLDDQQRQAIAETLGIATMLIATRYLDANQRQNEAARAAARNDALQMAQEVARIDLMHFDLTEAGFIPANPP